MKISRQKTIDHFYDFFHLDSEDICRNNALTVEDGILNASGSITANVDNKHSLAAYRTLNNGRMLSLPYWVYLLLGNVILNK